MPESLIDGTGNSYGAKIDINGNLYTFAVTEPEDKRQNKAGKNWSLPFTVTPTGAGDYFFYLRNLGDKPIGITDVRISCASADIFSVNKVSGTPTYTGAVADITPVSKNLGRAETITGTVKKDVDITGLTDEGQLYFITCDTANRITHLPISANIILPKGTALGMYATTGTAAVRCVVSIVEYA